MDINLIRNIVSDGYWKILLREPDPGGLNHYVDEIYSGRINSEKFYEILRNSEEFKNRFGERPITELGSDRLTYCMIGGNKFHEIKDYIPTILPYIDRFIYIDSFSNDGSIEFLRDLSTKNSNKITIIQKEWQDKFSFFRNYYLDELRNEGYNGWVIVSDSDEYYPPETLSQLRNLIKESNNGRAYNGVQFRSFDIYIDDKDRFKIVNQNLSNYWKGLMFKFHPSIRYEGEPHETLVGVPINWRQTEFIYKHVRSQTKIYNRAIENFFISNSNRRSAKWSEFRGLCNNHGLVKFFQFFERFKIGGLPPDIESWILNHRNDSENEGDSEIREMAQLYFDIKKTK